MQFNLFLNNMPLTRLPPFEAMFEPISVVHFSTSVAGQDCFNFSGYNFLESFQSFETDVSTAWTGDENNRVLHLVNCVGHSISLR